MLIKNLTKMLLAIIWIINILWATACALTGAVILLAVFKWATASMPEESYFWAAPMYIVAVMGLMCKFASKYWSKKGTTNGMELIKWDGKLPDFKKAEDK